MGSLSEFQASMRGLEPGVSLRRRRTARRREHTGKCPPQPPRCAGTSAQSSPWWGRRHSRRQCSRSGQGGGVSGAGRGSEGTAKPQRRLSAAPSAQPAPPFLLVTEKQECATACDRATWQPFRGFAACARDASESSVFARRAVASLRHLPAARYPTGVPSFANNAECQVTQERSAW